MHSGSVSGKHEGFSGRVLIKSVQLQWGQKLRRGVSDVCPSVNCDIWSAAKPLWSCRACQRTAVGTHLMLERFPSHPSPTLKNHARSCWPQNQSTDLLLEVPRLPCEDAGKFSELEISMSV